MKDEYDSTNLDGDDNYTNSVHKGDRILRSDPFSFGVASQSIDTGFTCQKDRLSASFSFVQSVTDPLVAAGIWHISPASLIFGLNFSARTLARGNPFLVCSLLLLPH